ncbi:MAG: class I SAM-dependent methyltransferase [Actinomycetota bacterium]|nr:class I SAM-dependent methyltransferase [Actinomycetota bacterium]
MAQRDWFEWHQPYDDSASPLAGRLRAVQHYVVEFLDSAPPGEISVVSMCAGQGRDLLEVLTRHPRRPDVAALLVELDPRNAKVAMDAVATAGLKRVEVVTGDASITTAYEGMVPCDLVLARGVFGHAADGDIEGMIRHLPTLCAPAATVVWTRGALGFDIRPTIRKWFLEAGFEEINFTSGDGGWGVGANRMVVAPQPYRAGIRLFTFVDELPSR